MDKKVCLTGVPTDKKDKFVKMLESLEGLNYSDARFLLHLALEKVEGLAIIHFEALK